jgi:hypothetical protein
VCFMFTVSLILHATLAVLTGMSSEAPHFIGCRLIRLLSTRCRAAAFFSACGAARSQEVPTVKWMSNQRALWTPGTTFHFLSLPVS